MQLLVEDCVADVLPDAGGHPVLEPLALNDLLSQGGGGHAQGQDAGQGGARQDRVHPERDDDPGPRRLERRGDREREEVRSPELLAQLG